MVKSFQQTTEHLIKETFPEKKITLYQTDKPWFTEELRLLKRRRLREYSKNGKSNKYYELVEKFESKSREAIHKYKEKIKEQVVTGDRGSTYLALKVICTILTLGL